MSRNLDAVRAKLRSFHPHNVFLLRLGASSFVTRQIQECVNPDEHV